MLTPQHIQAAKALLATRPAVLPGTRVILDDKLRDEWHAHVCDVMSRLNVPDILTSEFFDVAGVQPANNRLAAVLDSTPLERARAFYLEMRKDVIQGHRSQANAEETAIRCLTRQGWDYDAARQALFPNDKARYP